MFMQTRLGSYSRQARHPEQNGPAHVNMASCTWPKSPDPAVCGKDAVQERVITFDNFSLLCSNHPPGRFILPYRLLSLLRILRKFPSRKKSQSEEGMYMTVGTFVDSLTVAAKSPNATQAADLANLSL